VGRCGDNVKVDLEELVGEHVDWIKLVLDITKYRGLVNSVINLHAP